MNEKGIRWEKIIKSEKECMNAAIDLYWSLCTGVKDSVIIHNEPHKVVDRTLWWQDDSPRLHLLAEKYLDSHSRTFAGSYSIDRFLYYRHTIKGGAEDEDDCG